MPVESDSTQGQIMATCQWQCGRFTLDLSAPKIMGIVNITPDSFSDGGTYSASVQTALAHAEALLESGADILDIGGESTRPGAAAVSAQEEWARVQPVLEELVKWQVPISLDTRRTAVMQQALAHGYADIINDVSALGDEGAIGLLAQQAHTGICLMHMQGMPETMQQSPSYQDVAEEVLRYLNERVAACEAAGIARARLVLDPGFGFGKTLPHNIALMQHLGSLLRGSGLPLLIGVSRKRMIGDLSGEQDAAARVHGSVAAALAAVARGAQIVRVHDVKATADALKVWQAVGVFEAV
jgi:dihydropteroate synthase